VLRLFTFDPPGITLGRAQDPARELDLAALASEDIRWAVRPTGGRAIWHEEEWTFSLVDGARDGRLGELRGARVRAHGRLLAAAFQRLGVPAVLAPHSARGARRPA
jgi:lipoate-protein ligase A